MKKYIFLTFLLAMSVSAFAGKIQTWTKTGEKSNGCSGSGICYITTSTSSTQGMIAISWDLNIDQSQITMYISDDEAEKLSAEIFDNLHQGFFQEGESFAFPTEVNRTFSSDAAVVIPAGRYTAVHTGTNYVITIRLQ